VLVLRATLFGSLWALADEGRALAATLVTIGVAISLLPALIRVLPPLARAARTSERDASYAVTVVGLILYAVVVGGVIALININWPPGAAGTANAGHAETTHSGDIPEPSGSRVGRFIRIAARSDW
jgi:hypothetical protein